MSQWQFITWRSALFQYSSIEILKYNNIEINTDNFLSFLRFQTLIQQTLRFFNITGMKLFLYSKPFTHHSSTKAVVYNCLAKVTISDQEKEEYILCSVEMQREIHHQLLLR